MTDGSKKIIEIIKSIPNGKVMTYGQVGALAGYANGARQVVRILHTCSEKYNLPWHRVINSKGMVAIKSPEGYMMQKTLLEREGVVISENGEIDLNQYLYTPYS